jgi:hypothetical protein
MRARRRVGTGVRRGNPQATGGARPEGAPTTHVSVANSQWPVLAKTSRAQSMLQTCRRRHVTLECSLCLLKSLFLLRQLMLQPPMDTLPGDDVGTCLASPDPPHMGAFARRASARGTGLAAPAADTAALPGSAVAVRAGGPLALGRALACADGMANGARHRQALKPSSPGTDEASDSGGHGGAADASGDRRCPPTSAR